MNIKRSLVTLVLLALCGLGFLSTVFPIVNLIMTITGIAVFVIGAVIATVHLVRTNRTIDDRSTLAPVPPETMGRW